ncbi:MULTISPECIES: hypothetical protein [unclassified Bradyrhizobium]|uniref:helix-turn-helix domain-containing protein n=1 Tax=unclassified Bradyrhizobium TaxID=2631580 RepID=UPI002915F03C|nr:MULTISPECIES: hypothetical protein [unclassified Bradyrhizobium]
MDSFEIEIDEKSRAGAEFMARVVDEIRRAVADEKARRKQNLQEKLTQQSIAEKVGTSRAVINRQIGGLENLTARRIGEILWAIGWEPHFEARPIPEGDNQIIAPAAHAPAAFDSDNQKNWASALDSPNKDEKKPSSAREAAYA